MMSYDGITNTKPVFRAFSVRPMTSYADIRLKKSNDVNRKKFFKSERRRLEERICIAVHTSFEVEQEPSVAEVEMR